jgi:DNA ligase (NAD+)
MKEEKVGTTSGFFHAILLSSLRLVLILFLLAVLDRIADLPGWGELSSRNLAESIRSVASEGVPLSRYIYSLGIPLIGTYASQLLASIYGNIRSFLSALDEASLHDENEVLVQSEEVVIPQLFAALVGEVDGSGKVKGIGPAAISALLSFSKEEILMKAAKDLANVLTIHDDVSRKVVVSESVEEEDDESQKTKKKKPSPLKDMTVVFTGTIPGMSRTLAEKAAMKLGARATPSTVSKSTSLVVEGVDGGKKATKARELGVRVMDYVEFMNLADEP